MSSVKFCSRVMQYAGRMNSAMLQLKDGMKIKDVTPADWTLILSHYSSCIVESLLKEYRQRRLLCVEENKYGKISN